MNYIEYFLNHSNHQPNVSLDYISYHNYVNSFGNSTVDHLQYYYFEQADFFIEKVKQIEKIRTSLSPGTKTSVNELGTMLSYVGRKNNPPPIPKIYWNLSGENNLLNSTFKCLNHFYFRCCLCLSLFAFSATRY